MPSGRRRFVVRHPVVVDIGCSCRRPKIPSFFSFSSKPKLSRTSSLLSPSPTTSHWETSLTATTTATVANSSSSPSRYGGSTSSPSSAFCPPESPKWAAAREHWKPNKKKNKCDASGTPRKGVVESSVAVVKESSDPYLDFRDSMLQMIVEMEIYAWEDVRELLHRFLALNAPRHHHLILRAFAEIWNGLVSPTSPSPRPSASASASAPRRSRRR
ncbi:unnamed protein product [Musa acuminata subsp. burmannicoides]